MKFACAVPLSAEQQLAAVVPQSTLLICGIGAGPRTNKLEPYPGSKNLMPTAFDRTIDFVAINVYIFLFSSSPASTTALLSTAGSRTPPR